MASDQDTLDGDGGFALQLENLRSAAKWLLATLAAIGALLTAGLPLTGINALPLDSWRMYVAIIAAVVTLTSIAFMIKSAATVLTQEWITLASFTDEVGGLPGMGGRRNQSDCLRKIEDRLNASHQELFGHTASTIAELHANLRKCHESLLAPSLLKRSSSRRLAARSAELRRAARDVVQAANYYYVLHLFQRLLVRMAWAAGAAVAGIVIFGYAVEHTEPPAPTEVRIVSNPSVSAAGAMR